MELGAWRSILYIAFLFAITRHAFCKAVNLVHSPEGEEFENILSSVSATVEKKEVNNKLIMPTANRDNQGVREELLVSSFKERKLLNTNSANLRLNSIGSYEMIDFKQINSEFFLSHRQHGFVLFIDSKKKPRQSFYTDSATSIVQLSKKYRNKIKFKSVDCASSLEKCEEIGINSFPSLVYYNNAGQKKVFTAHTPYEVLSKHADLITELDETDGKVYPQSIIRLEEFKNLKANEPVFFLYLHDYGSTPEDFDSLRIFARYLVGFAPLYRTDDEKVIKTLNVTRLPHLVAIRHGVAFSYSERSVSAMRNTFQLIKWASLLKYPLVPELTPAVVENLDSDSYLAIALINPTSQVKASKAISTVQEIGLKWTLKLREVERKQLLTAREKWWDHLRMLKQKGYDDVAFLAAEYSLPLPKNKKVTFVWVNSLQWKTWISHTFHIDPLGPSRFVLMDPSRMFYWDSSAKGLPLTLDDSSLILDTTFRVLAITGEGLPHEFSIPRGYVYLSEIKQYSSLILISLWISLILFVSFLNRRLILHYSFESVHQLKTLTRKFIYSSLLKQD
ncbi:Protein disulfide isomerase [Schizosaccharomyces pombe]